MKKLTFIILACFTWILSFSQVDVNQLFSQHPELIIKIQIQDEEQIQTLTRMLSIDKVTGNEVIAYTTQKEFAQFLELNIPYEIVERPFLTEEEFNMLDVEEIKKNRNDWNYYPTYDAYVAMMQQFASDYPEICRVVEFGTSVQNRKLLSCVISSNVHVREAEPQVFWTSSMHGDETTGYIMMLRLIDYLLSNYGTDSRITYLLDHLEIWINPLANPDGTYWTGNGSVSGSRRYNANNVDLNRNYKDWYYGNHPDYEDWQQETVHFMELQSSQTFTLGVNLHGGAEVCNYPWDNRNVLPADDAWWQLVCWEYADTAHAHAPSGYMNLYGGVVRGYMWYSVSGSRQDYTNYYDYNREFCLEISDTKNPSASQLPNYWNYNYRSFLNFTQQALYGIHGIVTDACSGEPIYAKISIPQDINNSFVMTDARVGYYARPIIAGNYSVTYSAEGYESQTISVTANNKQQTVQNIALYPIDTPCLQPIADFTADNTIITEGEITTIHFNDLSSNFPDEWQWYFEGGSPETSTDQNPVITYNAKKNSKSQYLDVKLVVRNQYGENTLVKEDYITIKEAFLPVANFTASQTLITAGESINFTDVSINADTWEWLFEGGIPETSTEQNPTVLYENVGNFTVKLTITNEFDNDVMLKENYITVQPLAIDEQNMINLKIFPNPISHETMLTIETDEPLLKIELMNLLGAVVKTVIPNKIPYTFSVAGVAKGSYLMKIETPKGVYMTKVQVQ